MKKVIPVIAILVAMPLYAGMKVNWGGLFYSYTFFWQNADFNDKVADGDNYTYIHADLHANADFGGGVSVFVKLGTWGMFGMHPIWGTNMNPPGYAVTSDPRVGMLEGYLKIDNLFDLPVSLKIGKQNTLYGDGAVIFDGGEDGFLGAKLTVNYGSLAWDFLYYRMAESGGIELVGTVTDSIPDDLDFFGTYLTYGFLDNKLNLSGYAFMRPYSGVGYSDNPIWVGARSEGSPVKGLSYRVEATLMMGKLDFEGSDTMDVDYGGMHALAAVDYTLPSFPLTLGGAFVMFTGDDTATTDKNELYTAAAESPYTFGFYKWWPGFGPAHTMNTPWAFATVASWDPYMVNLNVINGHVGVTQGPLTLRGDFFMYKRNWVPSGEKDDLGNEIGFLVLYNYRDLVTFGATVGYWMPGEIQKEIVGEDNASAMLGGSLFFVKGF